MDRIQTLNLNISRVGWGLLAILWGTTILFNFVPFSAGLIGTGLVLLSLNIVRSFKHLPTRDENTVLGILALAWGGLELARPLLQQLFPSADLDWVIFAILLIGFGVILLSRALLLSRNTRSGTFVNTHRE
jgi:hypothetical protein